MKKQLIYTLFLWMATSAAWAQLDRSVAPKAAKAPKIQLGEVASFELENGLKVFVVENHKLPRVSFSLSLNLDPVLEKEKVGYVSMAGQLLRRGTASRSKDQLDEEIDFIGAGFSTSESGIFASSLKKHQGKILELMTDVLYNPSFPREELDKIKQETISGLKNAKENPSSIASNIKTVLKYGKTHPYGEVQTEAYVENVTLEDCKKYYQTYFKPNKAYLVVVGDITEKEAKPLIEQYFGKWEKGDVPAHHYKQPAPPAKTEVALGDKTGAVQTVLAVTYPVNLKVGDSDYIKAVLLNQILGGSGARLYRNIREDKGFTYGAYSRLTASPVVGYFEAFASVRTEVTDSSLVEFFNEMRRIRDEKISEEEITRVKNVMTGSFARSLENPQTIARFALNTERYNLPKDYYKTYLEKISAITAEELQEVARKYILPENAYIVAVGDVKAIEKKLEKFGKVTKYDAFGTVDTGVDQSVLKGMTAEKVIDKYLTAIGGREKLKKVKSIAMTGEIDVQGNTVKMEITKKAPNKMLVLQKLPPAFGGTEMKVMVFDGKKATVQGMGGAEEVTGDKLKDTNYSSRLFWELEYKDLGVKAALTQIKKIQEKPAFQIVFTNPTGTKSTKYYDVETGYLVKYEDQGQSGQPQDYKEVEGIKFPHTILTSSPMGELPLKITSIKINTEIDDALFSVN